MSVHRLRILFTSVHGYVDPSSGAATATRDLLELLAERGHDCRVLSTGVLDYREETPFGPVIDALGVPVRLATAARNGGGRTPVLDFDLNGVRVTLMPTASSRYEAALDRAAASAYLDLTGQVLARFRPHVLLTYGGHPTSLELMRQARSRGVAVVFHLHNFGYPDRSAFVHASIGLVPTEYSRRFHHRTLGLECTALDLPIRPERTMSRESEPRFLTFVNPVPEKGLAVFARIALELSWRRVDIPILVVEGRGSADWLARVPLDLSNLTSLHRMASTPDPRDFYRVTRALVVPSLWRENAALVAREGLTNGIPVLASDRGGLPETLGDAGFVFAMPQRCIQDHGAVPTSREVAPWIAAIERLWGDPAFEARHRERARAEARRRWDLGRLLDSYETVFRELAMPEKTSSFFPRGDSCGREDG